MKKRVNWKVLIVSFVIVFGLLAGVGTLVMQNGSSTAWYESIKPTITPPGYVFPIVWNILFVLIAFSLYFAWTSAKNKSNRIKIAWAYGANFVFNILWSLFFFGMKNPLLGFIDIILVWFTIVVMFSVSSKISTKAEWLLLPYFLWVSFATILNYLIAF